jgi:hypothetical protein
VLPIVSFYINCSYFLGFSNELGYSVPLTRLTRPICEVARDGASFLVFYSRPISTNFVSLVSRTKFAS